MIRIPMESSRKSLVSLNLTPSRTEPRVVSLASSALAALALIVILFADVMFQGASLAPLDYLQTLSPDREPVAAKSLYPELPDRKITDYWGDIGSAAWQLQPAIGFMADCIHAGESPWWNPYDSSGRMEPEGLYSVPFSPVVLITASFGASSTAISFVLLFSYFACVLALIRSFNRYLEISFLGACAGSAIYLLNGFAVTNLNTSIGQPYFLAPVLLLALLRIGERPSILRVAIAALVQCGMLTSTILPPMLLATLACYGVALAWIYFDGERDRKKVRTLAAQLAVAPLGLLLAAFLYFPLVEAQLKYASIGEIYNTRQKYSFSLQNALSFFTPKHLWHYYDLNALVPSDPSVPRQGGIVHTGLVAFLLAGCGVASYSRRRTTAIALVTACLLVLTFGQMFSFPVLNLVGLLPLFNITRPEYWPALEGLPLAVLVALGLDRRGKGGEVGLLVAAFAIGGSFLYLLSKSHPIAEQLTRPAILALLAFFLLGAVGGLYIIFGFKGSRYVRAVLAASLLVEGVYYMNTLRPRRSTRGVELPQSIQMVKDRIASGGGRVLNIGRSGLLADWGGGVQIPEAGHMGLVIVPSYRTFFNEQLGAGLFETIDVPTSIVNFSRASLAADGIRFVIVERECVAAIARVRDLGWKEVAQDRARLVFERPDEFHRFYLASALIQDAGIPPDLTEERIAASVDPAFLAAAGRAKVPSIRGMGRDKGTVTIDAYRHTGIVLRTSSVTPAVLVVPDSWHPNWRARLDGADVPVGLVNMAFRGVVVPPGSHRVEFHYRPQTLTLGLWISGLTLLTLAGLSVRERFGPAISMRPSRDQESQYHSA